MGAEQIELRVALDGSDDDEALAESASQLLEELSELDVDDVQPATAGDAPAGSKGIELVALGALIVKLARSGKILGQVVGVVRDWMTRNSASSVRLEIDGDVLEIKGVVSPDERKTLIDSWVQRHTES
jgi:hypothetical protein